MGPAHRLLTINEGAIGKVIKSRVKRMNDEHVSDTPPPKGSAYLKRSPETELMKNTSQNHHPQRPAQRPPGKPSLLSGAPETAGRLEGRKLKILAVLPGTAQRKTANVSVNVTSF